MKENRKMKNIKTIIWDCDNTIWIHRKDEIKIISKEFGIPVTKEFEKQYFSVFKAFTEYFADRKVKYWAIVRIVEENMPILSEYGLTAAEFLKKWLKIETSFLNEDALDVIKNLKSRGYKNIILTDWLWNSQMNFLKKYGILPYIDQIFTIDDQYLKKNPKSAARIIGANSKKDYVIIGDSLKDDIAFANHAGIKSIWYNPEGKKNKTNFKPTLEISSMLEVCKIIN